MKVQITKKLETYEERQSLRDSTKERVLTKRGTPSCLKIGVLEQFRQCRL